MAGCLRACPAPRLTTTKTPPPSRPPRRHCRPWLRLVRPLPASPPASPPAHHLPAALPRGPPLAPAHEPPPQEPPPQEPLQPCRDRQLALLSLHWLRRMSLHRRSRRCHFPHIHRWLCRHLGHVRRFHRYLGHVRRLSRRPSTPPQGQEEHGPGQPSHHVVSAQELHSPVPLAVRAGGEVVEHLPVLHVPEIARPVKGCFNQHTTRRDAAICCDCWLRLCCCDAAVMLLCVPRLPAAVFVRRALRSMLRVHVPAQCGAAPSNEALLP